MRGLLKLLAVAVVTAAFAAPAAAAGYLGGGGPSGGGPGGGGPSGPNAGPPWIPPGGGDRGSHAPHGPNHGPGGGAPPPHPGGPNAGFRPPHHGGARYFGGEVHIGDNWSHRPRYYWLGGGPVFVPEPSGDYVYSDADYDDGSDPTGCSIYRKAHDSGGAFLGFVRFDLCEGQ